MVQDGSHWRVATDCDNPIWACVVVNYADSGLQFFLDDCTFYVELRFGLSPFAITLPITYTRTRSPPTTPPLSLPSPPTPGSRIRPRRHYLYGRTYQAANQGEGHVALVATVLDPAAAGDHDTREYRRFV
ncbi:hypothetical protein OIDMADRAFT_31469 [Oidiodendron maius Zn]|uniref:Uncharacterized protein n=1 Tax=Oidiodendron maius (strain Zn) TaxID=913774 RepID=A0A0C3H8K7_OIDMZ|nr:hypothetical protein OIDMADRAFT_31469 [Oidiodendron maius Zn]